MPVTPAGAVHTTVTPVSPVWTASILGAAVITD